MINSNEIIRGCSLSEARYMLDHFYGRTVELVSCLDYFNYAGDSIHLLENQRHCAVLLNVGYNSTLYNNLFHWMLPCTEAALRSR